MLQIPATTAVSVQVQGEWTPHPSGFIKNMKKKSMVLRGLQTSDRDQIP